MLNVGRWMSRDPLGYIDSFGLYEYASGQPLRHRDPMGTTIKNDADNNGDWDRGQWDDWIYCVHDCLMQCSSKYRDLIDDLHPPANPASAGCHNVRGFNSKKPGKSGNVGINVCEQDSNGNDTGNSTSSVDPTRPSIQGYTGAGTLVHELLHAQKCKQNKGKPNKDGNEDDEADVQEKTDEIMAGCGHCQDDCVPEDPWRLKQEGKVLHVGSRW